MAKYTEKKGYILAMTDVYKLYDFLRDNEKNILDSFMREYNNNECMLPEVKDNAKPGQTVENQRVVKPLCKFYDSLIENLCDSTDIGQIWRSKAKHLNSILPPEYGIPNTDYFLIFKPNQPSGKAYPSSITVTAAPYTQTNDIVLETVVTGSPVPAGYVQFYVDNEKYGPALPLDAAGRAALIWEKPADGEHTYKAEYLGDQLFKSKMSAVSVYSTGRSAFVKNIHYTPTSKTVIRDGGQHAISVAILNGLSDVKIEYSADGEIYSEALPTFTDAGTYTVYYKVTCDGWNEVNGSEAVMIREKIAETEIYGLPVTLVTDNAAEREREKDISSLVLQYIDRVQLDALKNHVFNLVLWYKIIEKRKNNPDSLFEKPSREIQFSEAECVFFSAAAYVHERYPEFVKSAYTIKGMDVKKAVSQIEPLLVLLRICCGVAGVRMREIREQAFEYAALTNGHYNSEERKLKAENKKRDSFKKIINDLEAELASGKTIDALISIHKLNLDIKILREIRPAEFKRDVKSILEIFEGMTDAQKYALLYDDTFNNTFSWLANRVNLVKDNQNMQLLDSLSDSLRRPISGLDILRRD